MIAFVQIFPYLDIKSSLADHLIFFVSGQFKKLTVDENELTVISLFKLMGSGVVSKIDRNRFSLSSSAFLHPFYFQ